MPDVFEVPLTPVAQTFPLAGPGGGRRFTLAWRNAAGSGWCLDIADADGNPLVSGIPLVTGCDLLAGHKHLIPFGLWVQGDPDPTEVPTYDGLGEQSKMYLVVA